MIIGYRVLHSQSLQRITPISYIKIKLLIKTLSIALALAATAELKAQTIPTDAEKAAQYTKTITDRSNKIVAALGITDSAKYKRVLAVIVNQYRGLNDTHDARNAKAKQIKEEAGTDKAAANSKIQLLDSTLKIQLTTMHTAYINKLGKDLKAEQVDKVKDLMTFNILPITYKAYLEEVLTLTDVQKAQIKTWLVEARELAIDAESADKKHAVFGKYKGRINNFLSAQGYDMKKEGEEWQKRIKAAKESKQ